MLNTYKSFFKAGVYVDVRDIDKTDLLLALMARKSIKDLPAADDYLKANLEQYKTDFYLNLAIDLSEDGTYIKNLDQYEKECGLYSVNGIVNALKCRDDEMFQNISDIRIVSSLLHLKSKKFDAAIADCQSVFQSGTEEKITLNQAHYIMAYAYLNRNAIEEDDNNSLLLLTDKAQSVRTQDWNHKARECIAQLDPAFDPSQFNLPIFSGHEITNFCTEKLAAKAVLANSFLSADLQPINYADLVNKHLNKKNSILLELIEYHGKKVTLFTLYDIAEGSGELANAIFHNETTHSRLLEPHSNMRRFITIIMKAVNDNTDDLNYYNCLTAIYSKAQTLYDAGLPELPKDEGYTDEMMAEKYQQLAESKSQPPEPPQAKNLTQLGIHGKRSKQPADLNTPLLQDGESDKKCGCCIIL